MMNAAIFGCLVGMRFEKMSFYHWISDSNEFQRYIIDIKPIRSLAKSSEK